MKILLITTHDDKGGAGKVVESLSQEYIKLGHEVSVLAKHKGSSNPWVKETSLPFIFKKVLQMMDNGPSIPLHLNPSFPYALGLFGENIKKEIEKIDPDVVHFHWIGKGFVSLRHMAQISQMYPTLWTSHDHWPITEGGFNDSSQIPLSQNYSSKGLLFRLKFFDLVRRYKVKVINKSKIHIITPSRYLADLFVTKGLKGADEITPILNGVDATIFKVLEDEANLYKFFDLAKKKYLIFGGNNPRDAKVKGLDLLKKSLKSIEAELLKNDVGIITFGAQNPLKDLSLDPKITQVHLGYISDRETYVTALNLAHLSLVPSRMETLSLQTVESLLTGTPVVAYRVGGIPEVLMEGCGELVEPYQEEAFAQAIKRQLNKVHDPEKIRAKIVNQAALETIAQLHLDLYNRQIKSHVKDPKQRA